MKIRRATKKDINPIRKIALASWLFAYKNIYKTSTIKKMVADYYSDKSFENDFEKIKIGKSQFIVVTISNKIVGYAQVSKEKKIWDVGRIYVSPKATRKGIGSKLLRNIETFLKSKGVNEYVIYPHIKNKIAINFYKKLGFVREPKLDHGSNSPCYWKELK